MVKPSANKETVEMNILQALLYALTICLVPLSAAAEETSPPVFLSGGVICDTLDDVIATLETNDLATTCGVLRVGLVGTVTPVAIYEAHDRAFNLVRYDFRGPTGFNPVQYGWFGEPVSVQPAGQSL